MLAGKRSLPAVRDGGPEPGATLDAVGTGRLDLIDDLYPALAQLAKVVPVVVVVEDLHLVDDSLTSSGDEFEFAQHARVLAHPYDDAGRLLGVSARTVARLVADGKLRAISVGGSKRIPHTELEHRVASHLEDA